MGNVQRIIETLDNDKRREIMPPDKILKMLPIKKDSKVLDLGAGIGYLTIPIAKETENKVYALDLNPTMLDIIKSKASDEKLENIQLIKSTTNNTTLSSDSIDIVLASLILHEVKPIANTLEEIKRILKDDGYFLCVEIEPKVDDKLLRVRISSKEMEEELKNCGFNLVEKVVLSDSLYVMIAKK